MKPAFVAAALAISLSVAQPALAGPRCHTPMTDWQPREALQEKVRSMGWTIIRIKTDDGCYKVRATNEQGQQIKAKFDPGTLEIIKQSVDDD